MNPCGTTLELVPGAEPIQGYVLDSRIGVGGYGEVWKACAPGGLTKAIKFVRGRIDDKWAERELAALSLAKQLSHPFLLSLERIEVVEDQLVIVTEMADSSLKHRFDSCRAERRAGIPHQELTAYLLEAAEALDYLREGHALQHLDVKPENMLLVKKHVKIADFGLLWDLEHPDTMSVNGLTPKYAAPEVFAGRPSPHSDQYSLALSFCELATGHFPFSGQSPAVLTSQHLNSAPDLSRLSPVDRRVVERALAKDPDRRFDSCSEFVARLRSRESAGTPTGPPLGAARNAPLTLSPALPSPALADDTASVAAHDGHTLMVCPATTAELPAPAFDACAVAYRPCVFVGLGGTGAAVLCRLRHLLQEQFEHGAQLPALQFLLIDTDPGAVNAVLAQGTTSGLTSDEVCTTPLRSGWDYRGAALGDLPSLNRRWLQNIPRSQRTEGIRPLGRVALLDHAASVRERLRGVVAAATTQEAAQVTGRRTGLPFHDDDPRVFLVASLSGGTGGGMLVDVTYAVRQVLAEAGLPDDQVYGLLTYTLGHRERASGVAAANACSCLEELRHFSLPQHSYPGEPKCSLQGFREDRAALNGVYLLETEGSGAEPNSSKHIDQLARYLFLSSVTPASGWLDRCRGSDPQAPARRSLNLRTLSVQPLTAESSWIPSVWSDRSCQLLAAQWRGEALEQTAGDMLERLELGPEQVFLKITSLVADARGQRPAQDVESVLAGLANQGLSTDCQDAGQLHAALAAIDTAVGIPDAGGAHDVVTPRTFRALALQHAHGLAKTCAQGLQDSLFTLAESGRASVMGAVGVLDQITAALETHQEEICARLRSLRSARREYVEQLARRTTTKLRRTQPESVTLQVALIDYAQLATDEIILEASEVTLRHVRSLAKGIRDELYELARILGQISEEFGDGASQGGLCKPNDDRSDSAPSCGDSAARIFASHEQAIVEQLDVAMRSHYFQNGRRLRELLRSDGSCRSDLVASLRAAAGKAIRHVIDSVALTEIQSAMAQDGSELAERLTPTLTATNPEPLKSCGGARRLLLTGPDAGMLAQLRQQLEPQAGAQITTLTTRERRVYLCCEAEDISLESLLTRLITSQPNCRDLAARLHTRVDVKWDGAS
jgi:eukaryotic-like serine/threonine-protein kinase